MFASAARLLRSVTQTSMASLVGGLTYAGTNPESPMGTHISHGHAHGKGCRVCSDQPNTLRGIMSLYHNIDATSKPASAGAGSGSSAAAAGTAAAAAATDDNDTLLDDDDNDDAGVPHVPFEKQCPATYKELGNSTWTYLHTMAAYYPERPSTALAASMTPFLRTFAQIYPCETCRDHMIKYVDAHPPRAGSNAELSLYLCEFHNDVSRELGKPQVPCDAAALIRRYRDGPEDGSCD